MNAFPKIFHIGEAAIPNLFSGDVEITEKVDGSQFCFGLDENGERQIRSKGQDLSHFNLDTFPKMFRSGLEILDTVVFPRIEKMGWEKNIYLYAEYLEKPKHNTLNYARIPKNHLYLFGIQHGSFIKDYARLQEYAFALDVEPVNVLHYGQINSADELKRFLQVESILGNEKVEGVVVKNYHQPIIQGGLYIPISMGKYVQESFKERNSKEFHTSKQTLDSFIESFRTEARWHKAIQHLRDDGLLINSPKDIGPLMQEIARDLVEEEGDLIRHNLYRLLIEQILRKSRAGFPEWYKEQLMAEAFHGDD